MLIEWCNNNIGFASLMLSVLTLFVSILAVFVAIRTAQLPYKKKIMLSIGNFVSMDSEGIYVSITNVGNRKVKIKKFGLLIGEKYYFEKDNIHKGDFELNQCDEVSNYFQEYELKQCVIENKTDTGKMVFAYAEDTEGKKYKKRIGKLSRIIEIY